jgi:hypothetical protein
LQAVRLERDAFVWMDFNDRATGDAAILVAGTQILLALGTGASIISLLNPFTLVSVIVAGLFFWLIYSGATYAIARFVFDAHGEYPFYLRVTGFAYPTLLVLIFADLVFDNFALILIVGAALFVVIVSTGIAYISDLNREKAFGAAIGGYVAVTIIQTIMSGLRIF